jgi:hypothetical protein
MNERILELIRSADVHILPDDSEYGHCIVGLDRFAELLVKECADIVSKVPNGYRDYRNQIEDTMRGDCLQAIQEHFGVES